MQVSEDGMDRIAGGELGDALPMANPLIPEALADLGRAVSFTEEVRHAGALLAAALGADLGHAPRVGLSVAARALDQTLSLSGPALRERLWDLAWRDVLLGIACEGLAGSGPDGRPRSEPEREAVERGLYLVLRMVQGQEEVAGLEARVLAEARP